MNAEDFAKKVFDGMREQTRIDLQSDIDELRSDPRFSDFSESSYQYDNTPPSRLPKLREGKQYLPLWGKPCEK